MLAFSLNGMPAVSYSPPVYYQLYIVSMCSGTHSQLVTRVLHCTFAFGALAATFCSGAYGQADRSKLALPLPEPTNNSITSPLGSLHHNLNWCPTTPGQVTS